MTDPPNRDWIGRVKQADAEAEAAWRTADETESTEATVANALIAIAAELRAQRISRRPGAGMYPPPSFPEDKERYLR